MDFERLVEVYEEMEKTSSGNQIREILSGFFKAVPEDEIRTISYLTLGQISSDYDDVVLGMAEKSVLKAISLASGNPLSKVQELMNKMGDVGLTAENLLQKKPMTLIPVGKLTVKEMYNGLHKIAKMSGTGSQDQKAAMLVSLLQKTSAKGAKYICRIVLGTLRMGVGEMSVLDSLAIAFTGEKKNKEILEKAFNVCPDVGEIAEVLSKKGIAGLEKIDLHVGRPIKMMLAQRVESLSEVLERMPGKVAVEGKYDGERIQAHKDHNGKISLFSRRLDLITEQFPDLVEYFKLLKAKDFIVEGEVIAVDDDGKPMPFQTLMQRRRKYDVAEYQKKVPVQIKLFDLLYCDAKSYLHESYQKRADKLLRIVPKNPNILTADKIMVEDVEEIDDFFQKMLKSGYEGVIIKSLDGEYQAGTRGWNWIKWKKEYVSEMSDTFDLVVVGAYHGKGRRSGVYGALLCAVYNKKEDIFESICKLGTGLTDEMLEELPNLLKKQIVTKKPARVSVSKEMEPDIWIEPKQVVEVLAAEITVSPYHTLGLALRFPRFVKLREDKKAEQATTRKEIEEMFGKRKK